MAFTFVSGNLALDFAGTVAHRDTAAEDALSSPFWLGEWAVAAGLVDSGPDITEAELSQALAVREAVYRLARSAAAGEGWPAAAGEAWAGEGWAGEAWSEDDIEVVNVAAAGVPVTEVLSRDGLRRAGTARQIVATLARAAVVLLGGPDVGRIRQCEDPPCTRLFVDTSRARSRRWCEMSGCGNRAKVAGFRARRSGGRATEATAPARP
jgi:predicted RNA-binding Zn ribbon-like protein